MFYIFEKFEKSSARSVRWWLRWCLDLLGWDQKKVGRKNLFEFTNKTTLWELRKDANADIGQETRLVSFERCATWGSERDAEY